VSNGELLRKTCSVFCSPNHRSAHPSAINLFFFGIASEWGGPLSLFLLPPRSTGHTALRILFGHFFPAPNGSALAMGCLRFGDNEETLSCRLMAGSLRPDQLGFVMVVRWNWIHHSPAGTTATPSSWAHHHHGPYLELLAPPILLSRVTPSQPTQISAHISATPASLLDLHQPVSVHEVSSQPPSSRLQALHGSVGAKSIIYQTKQATNFFIVRLDPADFILSRLEAAPNRTPEVLHAEDAEAFVMFTGPALRHFPFVQVGRELLLANLKLVTLTLSPTAQRARMWATTDRTTLFPFDSAAVYLPVVDLENDDSRDRRQNDVTVIDLTEDDEEDEGVAPPTKKRKITCPHVDKASEGGLSRVPARGSCRTVSYQGTLTRIVSPTCGVFELDHKFLLVLQHAAYSYGLWALKIGDEILLRGVHVLGNHDWQHLYDLTAEGTPEDRVLGFVTCSASSLEVISSSFADSPLWVHFGEDSKLAALARKLRAYDILVALALEASFKSKFQATLTAAAIPLAIQEEAFVKFLLHLGFDKKLLNVTPGDFKTDVMLHDQHCEVAMATPTSRHSFPQIAQLQNFPLIRQFLGNYQGDEYESKTFHSDTLGASELHLFGVLRVQETGVLVIRDDTGFLPFVAAEGRTGSPDLNRLTLFDSFEVLVEILGPSTSLAAIFPIQ